MTQTDTIFALSSGQPPAGIAIIRISGPEAGRALDGLAGGRPEPRQAVYRRFRDELGAPLDDGLALWFPGPKSATGEDLAELHVHGGRAVVAAVLNALGRMERCRPAQAGEFTRRALENGRIDLTEAEGLADLLAAETEAQRQSALALAEGGLGRLVAAWEKQLLIESARVEALLDFADEGDVAESCHDIGPLEQLVAALSALRMAPPAERLRDGVRVVLAGPPNSGKSSVFNYLIGREAAIVTPIAGTTRDRIEAPVAMEDIPLLLIDTAGLREDATDAVEIIGIERSGEAMAGADILLWLGPAAEAPAGALILAAKCDSGSVGPGLPISSVTGEGMDVLRTTLLERARALLPRPGALALNARHREILAGVDQWISDAIQSEDLLVRAESLRLARARLDRLTGRSGVESMLDALFGAFCIGK
ncbi:MAG: tRNA uridine-5-carboxymethylaminomethyl(34) synthesis GTPase MnmE [Sphingomonadaceae bacterium]|nr:tRNA uridine-5-carboxymethylaminomethyl(34) synthesis GTPase MnmE [Sphingomonadaceae bacterium]